MIQVRRFEPPGDDSSKGPRFRPGTIVAHLRYHYRGVVVDSDPICMATEEWYQSNQTKPPRDEPWYHVLVEGGHHTTYVAQQNLMPDATGAPIAHPLVEKYFSAYDAGFYVRNDVPWSE